MVKVSQEPFILRRQRKKIDMQNFSKLPIRIVLINTQHPGNIGSAARAMKTMGFYELVLVDPLRYPAKEAVIMATGADDVLANAKIVNTLDEAIADCTLIFGTSARDRSLPWPLITPTKATDIAAIALQQNEKVAILFGREDKGLKNEELQRCHYHVQIPANPDYSSLNIAAAVQVITYQFRMNVESKMHTADDLKMMAGYDDERADNQTMELFFQHLNETLHQMDFLNYANPNRIMPRLRRVFNRAKPDVTEINILRGILSKIQWHLKQSQKQGNSHDN